MEEGAGGCIFWFFSFYSEVHTEDTQVEGSKASEKGCARYTTNKKKRRGCAWKQAGTRADRSRRREGRGHLKEKHKK